MVHENHIETATRVTAAALPKKNKTEKIKQKKIGTR